MVQISFHVCTLVTAFLCGQLLYGQVTDSHPVVDATTVAAESTVEKSPLKILFVGRDPDAKAFAPGYVTGKAKERYSELRQERTPAFKKLLEEHFESVTILFPEDYSAEMSKKYDVTVFDAMPPSIDEIDMGNWTKRIRMPYDFDCPAVMIGNIAPNVLGRNAMGLRLDHL